MSVIFEIGATVEKKIDTGHPAYMEYLQSLHGGRADTGARAWGAITVSLWGKAQVREGEDAQAAASDLLKFLNESVDQAVANLGLISDTGNDPYAFTTSRVNVNPVDGDF